ncbi:MAG: hypothetical protein FIA97_00125 [Methylococcaceae bacterium]|nr:hypothetical protein [Methylococcaceae bacterium]
MMSRVPMLALASLALTAPVTAGAVTIAASELPNGIQSCVSSGICSVDPASAYDSARAAAFPILQDGAGGIEQNWLMRYTLAPSSVQSRSNPAQTETLGGYLWMLFKGQYAATETAHEVTLFLDKVSPTPFSFFGQSGDLSLSLTTDDLLAGGGRYEAGLTAGGGGFNSGHLAGELPLPCVADGCGAAVQLNLLQLSYADNGSALVFRAFEPTDPRGLVFSQRSYYQGGDPLTAFDDRQTFAVGAVPLPASIWLLGSVVLGLAGLKNGRQSAAG